MHQKNSESIPPLSVIDTEAFAEVSKGYNLTKIPYRQYLNYCLLYSGINAFPHVEMQYLEYWLKEWKGYVYIEEYISNLNAYVELSLVKEKYRQDDIEFYQQSFEKNYLNFPMGPEEELIQTKKIEHLISYLKEIIRIRPNQKRLAYLSENVFSCISKYNHDHAGTVLQINSQSVFTLVDSCIKHEIYNLYRNNLLVFISDWMLANNTELCAQIAFKIFHVLLCYKDYDAINDLYRVLHNNHMHIFKEVLLCVISMMDVIPEQLNELLHTEKNQDALFIFPKLKPNLLFPLHEDFSLSMDNFLNMLKDPYLSKFLKEYYLNYLSEKLMQQPLLFNKIINYLSGSWEKVKDIAFVKYLLKNINKDESSLLSLDAKKFIIYITQSRPDIDTLIPLFANLSRSSQLDLADYVKMQGYGKANLFIKLFLYQEQFSNKDKQMLALTKRADLLVPIPLYVTMRNANHHIIDDQLSDLFQEFKLRFDKANSHALADAGKRYLVNYYEFMLHNVEVLIFLYGLMKDNVFIFMKKMIQTSVLHLKRYFDNLLVLSEDYIPLLKKVINKYEDEIFKNPNSLFDLFLIQISQFTHILEQKKSAVQQEFFKKALILELNQHVDQPKYDGDLRKIIDLVNSNIYFLYKKLLQIPENCSANTEKIEKDPFLLTQLLVARSTMRKHQLGVIFDRIVEADFRADMDFNYFATNLEQSNEFGKQLAAFNYKISQELSLKKIKTQLAFHYGTEKSFVSTSTEEMSIDQIAMLLLKTIADIKQQLAQCEFDKQLSRTSSHILSAIEKLDRQITREKSNKSILNGNANKVLSSIRKNLCLIASTTNQISNELIQFNFNFDELLEKLLNAQRKKTVNLPHKEFIIKQWDKNQIETFLLGDYFSCCLAINGSQFPAIVQRRMDAAMMMHVVYDKALNKPVCGNWLFFGYDIDAPDDVYVVANFFEIRTNYAMNRILRDKLVAELVDFTGQYAEDVAAKGFLMRPLTYGLIPDFSNQYSKKNIVIEKVGGFFSPNKKNKARARYYLTALDIDEFYVYTPKKPEQQKLSSNKQSFFAGAEDDVIIELECDMSLEF